MFNAVAGSVSGTGGAFPYGDNGQNVSLLTSPLFHVSGTHSTLVVGTLAGLKLVMPEGRFTPDHALQLIQDHGVTIWATVPTMVWRGCADGRAWRRERVLPYLEYSVGAGHLKKKKQRNDKLNIELHENA